MKSISVFSRPIESRLIIDILSETSILKSLMKHREFRSIHELLDKLLEAGIIDSEEYEDLMDRLVELTNLDGEEFREKAKELEQMLRGLKNESI